MYGFKVTVSLDDERPDDLPGQLDEVTSQLAIMHSREANFADFMVTRHVSGDTTYLIVVHNSDDESTGEGPRGETKALIAAMSWLHTAVHAAGFRTPGWLKRAEQVFTPEEVTTGT